MSPVPYDADRAENAMFSSFMLVMYLYPRSSSSAVC